MSSSSSVALVPSSQKVSRVPFCPKYSDTYILTQSCTLWHFGKHSCLAYILFLGYNLTSHSTSFHSYKGALFSRLENTLTGLRNLKCGQQLCFVSLLLVEKTLICFFFCINIETDSKMIFFQFGCAFQHCATTSLSAVQESRSSSVIILPFILLSLNSYVVGFFH